MKKLLLFLFAFAFFSASLSALSPAEEEEIGQIVTELEHINREQGATLVEQSITIKELQLLSQEQMQTIQNLEMIVTEQENSFNEQKKSWVYETIGFTAGGAAIGFIIGVIACLL